MVEMQEIYRLRDKIVKLFQPDKIILFGSYAYGAPTPDSDVDLLVVLPFDGKNPEKATEIWMATRPGFSLDLLVRKPAELRHRLTIGDPFIQEIFEKGVLLYETDHVGMD
jgi:predicted nucleotidyltransferase